ncbi:hypothetical protein [Hyphococcus sp.]|uniref:hypothetical protein n=1 Tax=Hyphococcus sp. TaxID=2038636 RepID=UPI003CCBBC9F
MSLRFIRSTCAVWALIAITACERETAAPEEPETQPAERVEALFSDELPGLTSPASGVAFWEHPTLSFNSLLIVANEDGVVSYTMENGTETGRIDGFSPQGAAVGYLGFGAQAAGFLTFFDAADSLFRFYGVDNATRNFLPLNDGPAIRGAVRGFCLGRAITSEAPALFVVQNARVQIFNLAADLQGVRIDGESAIETPDNIVSCAVDHEGVLLLGADDGKIYRVAGEDAFATPFAEAAAGAAGEISIISTASSESAASPGGLLLLLDTADGALHVFSSEDGGARGVVDLSGTSDMPDAEPATAMGAVSANLGGVYRDGAIAFSVDGDEGPVVRIAPVNSIFNALSLPVTGPLTPRGDNVVEEQDGLMIPAPEIGDQPE